MAHFQLRTLGLWAASLMVPSAMLGQNLYSRFELGAQLGGIRLLDPSRSSAFSADSVDRRP